MARTKVLHMCVCVHIHRDVSTLTLFFETADFFFFFYKFEEFKDNKELNDNTTKLPIVC